MADVQSRRERRARYSPTTHFGELDDDADRFDRAYDRLDARISRLMGVGVGILVSLTTTSILLFLNLVGR